MLKPVLTPSVLLVLLSTMSGLSTAQAVRRPGDHGAISRVDAYCRRVDAFAERHQNERIYFAQVRHAAGASAGRWQHFETDEQRDELDSNSVANVWLRGGGVILAVFTLQSDSRDWAHYVSFYYRPDGSLAKIDSVYNTFYGDFSIRRVWLYGGDRSLLSWWARYLDLTTLRPKRLNDEFIDQRVPMYPTTSHLPFSHLLASRNAPNDRLQRSARNRDD